MARQRKDTIVPEIVPINQNIFGSKDPIMATNSPTFWQRHHPSNQSEESKAIDTEYNIALYNLGNGAAKQISLEWSYDVEGFQKRINEFCQQLFVDLYIERTSENWLSFKRKNSEGGTVNLNLDLKSSIDYILPASIENISTKTRIPFSYKQLVSQYIQLLSKNEKNLIDKSILSSYPLKLKITYQDIAGNNFVKLFQFSIDIVSYASVKDETVTGFSGLFKVESKRQP